MASLKVGVLISGPGTNLSALIEASARPEFPAEIVLVISNVADAAGLAHAGEAGIATRIIDHKPFAEREDFESAIEAALAESSVELVCLAGFMRILTAGFVTRWNETLVNIHPSLLPAFPGLDTHARAIEAGVRFTGCTVHFVSPEVDAGPIIVQAAVPVLPGDDAGILALKVLEAEHRCYPWALRLIAEGRVRIEGDAAMIEGGGTPGIIGQAPWLMNPGDEEAD